MICHCYFYLYPWFWYVPEVEWKSYILQIQKDIWLCLDYFQAIFVVSYGLEALKFTWHFDIHFEFENFQPATEH